MVPLLASYIHKEATSNQASSRPLPAGSAECIPYNASPSSDDDEPLTTPESAPHLREEVVVALPRPQPDGSSIAELSTRQEYFDDAQAFEVQHLSEMPSCQASRLPLAVKMGQRLRLPSFDALGIAVPGTMVQRAFECPSQSVNVAALPRLNGHDISEQALLRSGMPPPSPVSEGARPSSDLVRYPLNPSACITHAQTPPDDSGLLDWGLQNRTAGPSHGLPLDQELGPINTLGIGPRSGAESALNVGEQTNTGVNTGSGGLAWLGKALEVILNAVRLRNGQEAFSILSHALPSPSTEGHVFPSVIEAIQQRTSSAALMWMNVYHAVAGRIKLEDLPKSPPTTPAPPFEGDDYFTQTVFDAAVPVPDYSQKATLQSLTARARGPAVAPCSINVSIVERFIPPTSTVEFDELFSVTGRSFLFDRLVELSASDGTLLFVYPTSAGGETFRKHYLDPILAPTLRRLMIEHALPQNIVEAIGKMDAIVHLPSFGVMRSKLTAFLEALSKGESIPTRLRMQNTTYDLIHASPQEVDVDRSVWAKEWWIKQEKARIQRTFELHDIQHATRSRAAGAFQAAEHLRIATTEAHGTGEHEHARLVQRAQTQALLREAERSRGERNPGDNEQMILQLMDEVANKPYRDGPPELGIEVGVFVIRKRSRDAASS